MKPPGASPDEFASYLVSGRSPRSKRREPGRRSAPGNGCEGGGLAQHRLRVKAGYLVQPVVGAALGCWAALWLLDAAVSCPSTLVSALAAVGAVVATAAWHYLFSGE